jgi:hypothetical protein
MAGTDPLSAVEVLRLTLGGTETRPTLQFPIRPNRLYSVERSNDLSTWVPVPGELSYPATGVAAWTGTDDSPSDARFLRVRVRLE